MQNIIKNYPVNYFSFFKAVLLGTWTHGHSGVTKKLPMHLANGSAEESQRRTK